MFFFRNKPLIALFGSDDCTEKKEVTYGSSGGRNPRWVTLFVRWEMQGRRSHGQNY